jgi:DDE superfamily endonuclease
MPHSKQRGRSRSRPATHGRSEEISLDTLNPIQGGLAAALSAIAKAHPGAEVQLWCQDEARVGQKGRGVRVWFGRGVRPEGAIDHRYASAWLYGAVRPGTDQAFALVLTGAGAAAMQVFLDRFAATLPGGVHAALLLDGAGWHTAAGIVVPDNLSLVFLPPYSPKLNPARPSGCGSTCASASSRPGCSAASTTSSRAAATPGTASSKSRDASHPSPTTRTSGRSGLHEPGISSTLHVLFVSRYDGPL